MSGKTVLADWWDRGNGRPVLNRDGLMTLPTNPPQPTTEPTVGPNPTSTPRIGGGPTETPAVPTPTTQSSGGNSSSSDDPCAPGKSYTGPYCGWSPSTGDGGSGGGNSTQPRIGGPEVLGLSYTASAEAAPSDIIFLIGVLCLALYVKSKLNVMKSA